MAKTGSITITTNKQYVAECYSNITVKGFVTTSGESWRGDSNTGTYEVYQDSKLIKSGSFTSGAPANANTQLFSVSLNVTHNTNGTSGTILVKYNYDSGWCTASVTQTLPTIDRYLWNDINVLNPSGIQDQKSAYFDLYYSDNTSYKNLLNEPDTSEATKLYGTVMTINNIRPYYPYYVLDTVTGATNPSSGTYKNTITTEGHKVEIKMKYRSHKIVFNANGGTSGNTTQLTNTYNSTTNYSNNNIVPSKEHYNFLGFFTEPEGGVAVYGANGLCVNGTGYWNDNKWCYEGTEDSITLYAHWKSKGNCYIKQNGEYVRAKAYVKQGGTYKECEVFVKSTGVYKQCGID